MSPLLPLLAAGLAVFTGCGRSDSAGPARAENLPVVAVRIATIESRADAAYEEVTGTVRPKLRAALEAKVSGRIARMDAEPGRRVADGDLLIELDAREIAARLEQARAGRDQAERDWRRYQTLLAQQAVTGAEAEAVESRLRGARASVAEAETMLGYLRLTAPFAGVVTRKLAEVGDLASPGRPLVELEDASTLRLEADVPESLVGRLSAGVKLPVRVGEMDAEGTVSEIAPAADPASRTFLVKLDLPTAPPLRSGQFGRVRVPAPARVSLRVPATAVTQRGQMEFVHIVSDGAARLRLVKTGRHFGTEVELISGVSAGEQVVLDPPAALHDGQPVSMQP
jgi:RND family efflux transporter MFP subunit